ncbi:MAG: GNAT family N-acetyltransferase [Anaerolineales bacterium]
MDIKFTQLTQPTDEIIAAFNRWENDPDLIPFMRVNQSQDDIDKKEIITHESLLSRIKQYQIYLIYLNNQLTGEINYTIDPPHLFKKELGTAWLGVDIGEKMGRGKGIGLLAIQFIEEQIKLAGYKRIELGVFEFNSNAVKLYQKARYVEIARIPNFTYWQETMWQDIRMEKYI